MSQDTQFCPICKISVRFFPRYPRYLCENCASRAKTKDGRLLVFSNETYFGGFIAHYMDTGEPYPSHECYIDGIECYADEHRFGGIVIQTVENRQ
jgi:hypothetical protein